MEKLRLAEAVQDASMEFWSEISKKYPEIKSGDLDIQTVLDLQTAMGAAVQQWIKINTGQLTVKIRDNQTYKTIVENKIAFTTNKFEIVTEANRLWNMTTLSDQDVNFAVYNDNLICVLADEMTAIGNYAVYNW